MIVLAIHPNMKMNPFVAKDLLKYSVLIQYVPRLLRIHPLFKEVTRTSGILTETAGAGAAYNLFLYMLASHVSLLLLLIQIQFMHFPRYSSCCLL